MSAITTSMIFDPKTGRTRRKDAARSRVMKQAARKRKGRKLSIARKKDIAKGVKRANRTGKNRYGRRVRTRKGHYTKR